MKIRIHLDPKEVEEILAEHIADSLGVNSDDYVQRVDITSYNGIDIEFTPREEIAAGADA